MDNVEKAKVICEWIDPKERVTVDFEDEQGLNAEVTGCTEEVLDLALPTAFPHLRQDVSLPLSAVEVGEDGSKYTRDPGRPLRYGRLRLTVRQKRPQVV